ncbi:MAG: PcfJ domain-containing protein [Ruminococcus sp.]|nr:PcfJ domain-containing protein [Ruminococcus sp.]
MNYFRPTPYDKYGLLPMEPGEEEEIASHMPHYLFYRRDKSNVDFYCTACHNRHYMHKSEFSETLGHKRRGLCPACQEAVEFRSMCFGRKTLDAWENFVIVRVESENEVHLECCGARLYFEEDDMEPRYDLFSKAYYELRPGSAQKYANRWCWYGGYDWTEIKTLGEPHFVSCFGFSDNSYYPICLERLDKTFLRYALRDYKPSYLVTYLSKYAKHPNIEYLVRGRFERIAEAVVVGGQGIYINWRSTDLKKMLRLDRAEINLLQGCSADEYREYISIRRHLNKESGIVDHNRIARYWTEFGYFDDRIGTISTQSGLTYKQIMDYCLKNVKDRGSRAKSEFLCDYRDYINDCIELNYDLTNRTVAFPRDLHTAHQRTMKAIVIKQSREMEERRAVSDKLREWLPYVSEEKGLAVILPKSVAEIVEEGRALSHCVGGYADRHAEGLLHIVFLRRLDDLTTPYYTIEVNTEGRMVQCRGYANNAVYNDGEPKPQEIKDFEAEYQQYIIRSIKEFKKKRKKKARRSA